MAGKPVLPAVNLGASVQRRTTIMKRTWPTLKGRLNHPLTSRVEALKQLQITMPLSPSAQRELKRSSNGSFNGPKRTAS